MGIAAAGAFTVWNVLRSGPRNRGGTPGLVPDDSAPADVG
jgi:hypothetical protein